MLGEIEGNVKEIRAREVNHFRVKSIHFHFCCSSRQQADRMMTSRLAMVLTINHDNTVVVPVPIIPSLSMQPTFMAAKCASMKQ